MRTGTDGAGEAGADVGGTQADGDPSWQQTVDALSFPLALVDARRRLWRLNRAARATVPPALLQAPELRLDDLSEFEPWGTAANLMEEAIKAETRITVQAPDVATASTWEVSLCPLSPRGPVLVSARDISRLFELQESLHKSETMAALGSIVVGVAHEVRTPLFGISATLQAFESRVDEKERYAPFLNVLRTESARLLALMHDLLEYGRPPRLTLADHSIAEVCAESIQRSAAHAEARGVRVDLAAGERAPILAVDRGRLVQVLTNLVDNAIDHCKIGGQVLMRQGESGEWVTVSVSDDGPGIRPDDLPKLFEPFFTKRKGGTGLGLSLVQRIVEQHRGFVIAANRPAGGAEVTIHLPREPRHVP